MKVNVLVDSYGWIEYFCNGPLARRYAGYIEHANKQQYFTPSVVVYEVCKYIKRGSGDEKALAAYGQMVACTNIIPLDEQLAFDAAEKSLELNLGLADAVIKAAAERHNCKIITSDLHFKGLDNATLVR